MYAGDTQKTVKSHAMIDYTTPQVIDELVRIVAPAAGSGWPGAHMEGDLAGLQLGDWRRLLDPLFARPGRRRGRSPRPSRDGAATLRRAAGG
eukprot:gene23009-12141_t